MGDSDAVRFVGAADVLGVPAGVLVGDEVVHRAHERDPDGEAEDDLGEDRGVEDTRGPDPLERLAEQPDRGGRDHEPRPDAEQGVEEPARDRLAEEERYDAQAGDEARQGGDGEGGEHAKAV